MKIADLYIRVSTDEQADKGYSQRDQEERLLKYCEINSLQVRKVIFEDHSAKTFKRPAWTQLLTALRKDRGHSDIVLFTKWDRFSRNAGDAYQMISTLRRLGVEPQAVEQPLDLSIPENKMMLAFYLAAPEVENDRRALNVFNGMRRAKKEGRYMGLAPLGYINKMTEDGKKYIAIKDDEAKILKWAFTQLGSGNLNTEQVWKIVREKGLRSSKSNFWYTIRNPMYCGKIFIPKYKDEDSYLVQGQHEALISEDLYYDVQDVLDGRKKKMRTKLTVDENLPLRGFLLCHKCGKLLTGSASKGRNQYYHYYHCTSSCGARFKAPEANILIVQEIRSHVRQLSSIKLYKETIASVYKNRTRNQRSDIQQLKTQLEEAQGRLSKARDLLLSGDIESDDYRIIKSESEVKVNRIEAKLTAAVTPLLNVEPLLDKAFANISQLDILYENGTVIQQRKIIGSMFPEKLVFDGLTYRTTRVNEAIRLMLLVENKLKVKKKGTNHQFDDLSQEVRVIGLEPTHREAPDPKSGVSTNFTTPAGL
jgi:site-specific DNA recombinase